MSTWVMDWEYGMEPLGPAVVAVGVFDGVHVGHQALVRDAIVTAREMGVQAVVLTFDRDPDIVVSPDTAAPQLLTLKEKIAFLTELAPDAVVVVGFCRRLADTAPDRFVTDVLMESCKPVAVVVGRDFRYGRYASGDVAALSRSGETHGFEVRAHDLVVVEGAPVTSTRIRGLIAAGDVAAAARLLGRPHRVRGSVWRGRGLGAELSVPTANIRPLPHSTMPADGVYAGRVTVGIDGFSFPAGISVGVPPTFPEARDDFEAHLIGYKGDLYHRELTVEFVERLRDQVAFDSNEALAEQMKADLAAASRIVEV